MSHLISQDWIDAQMIKNEGRLAQCSLIGTKLKANPCVAFYGCGPEGKFCKTCIHMKRHRPGKNAYRKCVLRGITSGPGTDHKTSWPACAKWEEVK